MKHDFDVIVIGGGHAGTEAAYASARLGVKTCLVTQRFDRIGEMSCNPAIGGLGKGHLVREIDALGGIMGAAADFAGIQFRLLNRSKGPAVRGPRAQADRARYKSFVQTRIGTTSNLQVLEGEVVDFVMDGYQLRGVLLDDGSEVRAVGCVLTTGTFLNGIIHIGEQQTSGGRIGDTASCLLAERVNEMGLPLGRLKTGTPPRLDTRSIDWDQVEMQPGDEVPELFSFLSKRTQAEQISCGITHTNAHTHEIVERNLSRSAMYGGHIDGVGPRYCPSIEDKVVRFAEKESHQVFLEPESLSSDVIYPNGISTSLPQDVQEAYVRTIRGLESAEIVQPGYAIEYDYVDPRSLDRSLRLEACEGLYLAGQINGTTGYEEAAAQGLVAGLSAALCVLGREPVVFARHSSYIGVLIDDLTTRGVSEPYRMFTSRAEFRLSLRADNADQRLTPLGIGLGIISKERKELFQAKMEQIERARKALEGYSLTPNEALSAGIQLNQDGVHRDGIDLLSRKDVSVSKLCALWSDLAEFDHDILEQIKRDAQYAPYIERQRQEMEALRRDENVVIPKDFDYSAVPGLSNELTQKLSDAKPATIAAAGRIDGVTPAALAVVLLHIKRLAA